MTILAAHALEKHFGERSLFENITFDVDERDKIGLVGDNGCGKTTLFHILRGEISADGGDVTRTKATRIGYMEQHTGTDETRTLWEEVENVFSPLMAMEERLACVNTCLTNGEATEALLLEQQQLQEQFAENGGLYYKSRVRATLLGLGFPEDSFLRPICSMSGGEKSKAAMGRLLLSDNNLLLLDEPTNHLDIPSVEWLEEFLRGYTGAMLIISHDRYFLDKVTNRTLEMCHGKMYATDGNYSAHRLARDKEREVVEKHYKTASREIKRIEGSIALMRQWNREKSIRTAESKEKMVNRLKAEMEIPEEEQETIRFQFTARYTSGNEVLVSEDLAMGFGDRLLFANVNLRVRRGERVFLLGPNGCGKTTLLKILHKELLPLEGSIRLGAKVTVGYYDQTQAGLDFSGTVMDAIWNVYPHLTQTEIRCALAAFLFQGDEVFKQVALLSGGERARLLLLKLMLARDNFLLLDEPTNHLDIASREALENALSDYDGTLFVVSHDRYFINRMASRILRLTTEDCQSFEGNYDVYVEKFQESSTEITEEFAVKENSYTRKKEQDATRRRLAAKIRRTEDDIAVAEQEIAALHKVLSTEEVAADYTKLLDFTDQLEQKNALLEDYMRAWEDAHRELEQL